MLVIKEEHAGKKVRCPKCQAVMQAPACESGNAPQKAKPAKRPELTAMFCGSGHRFAVRPEHLGLQVLCPVCEQPVQVLSPSNDSRTPARRSRPRVGEPGELVGASDVGTVDPDPYSVTHLAGKLPLTDEMVDSVAEERLLPLLLVFGTAAAALVGIAFWLRESASI